MNWQKLSEPPPVGEFWEPLWWLQEDYFRERCDYNGLLLGLDTIFNEVTRAR